MKIKVYVNTGFSSCKHEDEYELSQLGLTEEEWEEMTQEQKDSFLDGVAVDYMNGVIDFGAYED